MLKPKKTHFSLFPFTFSLLLCTFLSCQTASRTDDILLSGHLPLETGAYVYLLAEKDAIPVLNQLGFTNINNAQFHLMLDRTNFIAAAVYVTPNEKSNSYYRLAAWGDYPASRAKMGLNASKEWKKKRSPVSGDNYWHSPQNDLSVTLTGKVALAATAAKNERDPPDPYAAVPGIALPEGFAAFREGSILSCWLTDPGPAINQKLAEMKIPLNIPAQQLFVSLYPADDRQKYTARLQIQVENAAQARMLTMMFALMRNFIPAQTDANTAAALLPSILFANPPEQDENNLNITTAPLSAREIALLLSMFSLK